MTEDASYGWEAVAQKLIDYRRDIGQSVIEGWVASLPPGGRILDIGAGAGEPSTAILLDRGFTVSAVDASPTLAAEYRRRFPEAEMACEAAETSRFFDRTFDGAIAVGLIFLLPETGQRQLISGVASALNSGGRFLFTAPHQECAWNDNWTGRPSRSLGADAYLQALVDAQLEFTGGLTDEGGGYYFTARKL